MMQTLWDNPAAGAGPIGSYRPVNHVRLPRVRDDPVNGASMKKGRTSRTITVACRALALACACLATAAHAQDGGSTAAVRVVDDTRIVKDADLDFGRIVVGPAAGTITVAPDAQVTLSGGITGIGGTAPAAFTLSRRVGVDYLTYRAPTISDTIDIVHEADPTVTMRVRDFTTDFNRTKQGQYYIRFGGRLFGPFTGTVPGYWNQTSYDFRVGATLDVAANQPAGAYVGSFTVIVDYE